MMDVLSDRNRIWLDQFIGTHGRKPSVLMIGNIVSADGREFNSGNYNDFIQIDAAIKQGDVVVARRGEVHGVHNDGAEPLVMVAVVSPAESGFELLDAQARP